MNVPLFSRYKAGFILKRLLQTFFGGLSVDLNGHKSHGRAFNVYKVAVFLWPAVAAGLFSLLVNLNLISTILGSLAAAVIGPIPIIVPYLVGKCSTTEAVSLFPVSGKSIVFVILHICASSSLLGLWVQNLTYSRLTAYYQSEHSAGLVYFFSLLSLSVAHFSLTMHPPVEPATYRPTEQPIVASLGRPVHLILLLVIHVIVNEVLPEHNQSIDQLLTLLIAISPFLWVFGVLPPLTSLAIWLLERTNVLMAGGSPSASWRKMLLSVLVSLVIAGCNFFVGNLIGIVVVSGIAGFTLSFDVHLFIVQRRAEKNLKSFLLLLLVLSLLILAECVAFLCRDMQIVRNCFIYVMSVILALQIIFEQLQQVYFINLIRNPYYPASVLEDDKFSKYKKMSGLLKRMAFATLRLVLPLGCVFWVTLEIRANEAKETSFLVILLILRVYHKLWRSTINSVISLVIVSIFDPNIVNLHITVLWFVADFAIDTLKLTLSRLYMVFVLLVTCISLKKQRLTISWILVVLDIVLLPFIVGLVLFTSVLSIPILPLFTLPMYMIGFPRPTKFWPETVDKDINKCSDSVYYQQLLPKFVAEVSRQSNALSRCEAGSYLLGRYQDRMIWIEVVEHGYCQVKLCAKGLELQETSCHAVEATKVDQILEETFISTNSEKSTMSRVINPFFLYALQPIDTITVETYSDARNVLTGVIDSPETKALIKQLFSKVFLWVVITHRLRASEKEELIKSQETATTSPQKQQGSKPSIAGNEVELRADSRQSNQRLIRSKDVAGESPSLDSDLEASADKGKPLFYSRSVASPSVAPKRDMFSATAYFPDSETTVVPLDNNAFRESSVTSDGQWLRSDSLQALNTRLSPVFAGGDRTERQGLDPLIEWMMTAYKLGLKTRAIPDINQHMFSEEWVKSVVQSIRYRHQLDVQAIKSLFLSYRQLSVACYSSLFSPSKSSVFQELELTSSAIYDIFQGLRPVQELFNDSADLRDLTIKSFRYTVKLAFDQVLVGNTTTSTHDEIIESLIDFDANWFMGRDDDLEWEEAVLSEKAFLFSIGKDLVKDNFTGHLLTLQKIGVHLCSLNRALVEGIWSTLSLELFYLTNDDDERYSIQAHPVILRNLTVQAADGPLGYPIYVSNVMTVNSF